MLRVLVVDDEAFIRHGIINKLEKIVDYCNVVGEAQNGEEALNLVEALSPNIVITDIKMPKVDGLLFIEKALESAPNTKFIITSGYDDFEYARRAMKLGVFDYLLKPLSNAELKTALGNLRKRIENEAHRDSALNIMLRDVAPDQYIRQGRQVTRLIFGELSEAEIIAALAEFAPGMAKPGQWMVITAVIPGIDKLNGAKDESSVWKFAVANVFEEYLNAKNACISYYEEAGRAQIAVLARTEANELSFVAEVEGAVSEIRANLGIEAYAGVSRRFASLAEYPDKLMESRRIVEQLSVFPHCGVLTYRHYAQVKSNDYALDDEKSRLISYHLNFLNTNVSDLERVIDDIFSAMEARQVNYNNMRTTCISIAIHIFNEIKNKNGAMAANIEEVSLDINSIFERLYTAREYREQLSRIIRGLRLFADEDEPTSGKRIVSEIVRRVETEYYKDVWLSAFAAEYCINQSYLSTLFIKETGKKFSQHLTDVRIQKARELLVTTSFSVSRIAEFVGYKDRSYFTLVFQKATGLTPAAYRRLEKNTENPQV